MRVRQARNSGLMALQSNIIIIVIARPLVSRYTLNIIQMEQYVISSIIMIISSI